LIIKFKKVAIRLLC